MRGKLSSSIDRKSTRLNSSHRCISYAVFCLKKKYEGLPTLQVLRPGASYSGRAGFTLNNSTAKNKTYEDPDRPPDTRFHSFFFLFLRPPRIPPLFPPPPPST